MSKFLISNRRNGEFQFSLKDSEGLEVFCSVGYPTKIVCLAVIELIKKKCEDDELYDRQAIPTKFYYDLKTSKGYKIYTSEMFDSKEARDKSIDMIKTLAPKASIDVQVIVGQVY